MSTTFVDDTVTARGLNPGDRIHVPGESVPRVVREVNHGPDGYTSVRIGSHKDPIFYSFRTSALIHILGRAGRAPHDIAARPLRLPEQAQSFEQPDEPVITDPFPTGVQYRRDDDACDVPAMIMLPEHSCYHPTRKVRDGKGKWHRALDPHGHQWWHLACARCRCEWLTKGRRDLVKGHVNSYGVRYDDLVHNRNGRFGRRHFSAMVDDHQAIVIVTTKRVPVRYETGEDEHGEPTFTESYRHRVVVVIGEQLGKHHMTWVDREGITRRSKWPTALFEAESIIEVTDIEQGVLVANDLASAWQLERHRTHGGLPSWDEPAQAESPDYDPALLRLMESEYSAPSDEWEDRQVLPS